MSAASDSSDLAPSRDPADYGRRRLVNVNFLLWIIACVACLAIGAVIGRYAAHGRPTTAAPIAAAPPPTAAPTASAIPPPAPAAQPVSPELTAGGLEALGARLRRDEASAARVSRGAALALAAASLSAAAEGSGPFMGDLAPYQSLAPYDPDLRALAPLASRGAPSRAALAAALPDLAGAAVAAERAAAHGDTLAGRLWALIGRVAIVRRIDVSAPGADGALARAQAAASAGDLATALAEIRGLPPAARAPLTDWTAAAARRIAIDRALESLRARALADLAEGAGAVS